MALKTEYKRHPCIYCDARKLRRKLDEDWKAGDEKRSGRHTYATYWICDGCGKTSMSDKGITILSTVGVVIQLWLTNWVY